MILLSGASIFYIFSIEKENFSKFSSLNISKEYIDLSPKEIREAKEIIKSISPRYAKFVKNITVVSSMKDFCEERNTLLCRSCNKKGCAGVYYKKDIILQYSGPKIFRENLCHEITHGFIKGNDGWEGDYHQIIFDLAAKNVCYS